LKAGISARTRICTSPASRENQDESASRLSSVANPFSRSMAVASA